MPFLWGLIYFLRTTCYHAFNVLRKCMGLNLFCYTRIHESFAFIKSFDSLYSRNLLLFPLHAWTFLFRVSVLLVHWRISTTSKADLKMPRSWSWSVLDGWVLKMMGWWVTHNLRVEGFLSKERNTIAILTLPECPEHPPSFVEEKFCLVMCLPDTLGILLSTALIHFGNASSTPKALPYS
jgi:hypothetical protein